MDYRKRKKIKQLSAAIVILVFMAVALISALGKSDIIYCFTGLGKNTDALTDDFVKVIDVGEGDSILICSNGKSALVDTGDGSTDICSKLLSYGIKKIDVLLITHIHTDHTGGFDSIASRFIIDNLVMPDFGKTDENVEPVNTAVRSIVQKGGKLYTATQGMNFNIGDFEITVIGYYPDEEDENNRSVIVMAEIYDKRFLFTGDAESVAERLLLKDGINTECDVLKVGHHGSSNSCSKEFLNSCNPDMAVISCGEGNTYSHPHKETIEQLEDFKIKTYRTDLQGDITFYVEGDKITVDTEN